MRLWWLAAVLMMVSAVAQAQQTRFRSRDLNGARILEYRWLDKSKTEQAIKFSLSLQDVAQAEREFSRFDNADAQSVAFRAVQAQAKKLSNGKTQVEVSRQQKGYDIRAKGVEAPEMEKIAENLRTVRDQTLDDYIATRFYSRIDGDHIMPDHKRIAQRYVAAMAPLAKAVRNAVGAQADQRATINHLLNFFQSIPYDELENRYTSNGAGFVTPYALLGGNKGDCDSKSVALAATLRALYPDLRLTIMYVPSHAFVGILMPQGKNDYALGLNANTFVLADPTGPRLLHLGEVDPRAIGALNDGKFSYQEVPF